MSCLSRCLCTSGKGRSTVPNGAFRLRGVHPVLLWWQFGVGRLPPPISGGTWEAFRGPLRAQACSSPMKLSTTCMTNCCGAPPGESSFRLAFHPPVANPCAYRLGHAQPVALAYGAFTPRFGITVVGQIA